jgi:hypothetical protein
MGARDGSIEDRTGGCARAHRIVTARLHHRPAFRPNFHVDFIDFHC